MTHVCAHRNSPQTQNWKPQFIYRKDLKDEGEEEDEEGGGRGIRKGERRRPEKAL